MKQPTISVIVNLHNEKRQWIRRSIGSVMRQIEPPDYELIVVADKASDEVVGEVAALRAERQEIVLRMPGHGDLGPARNTGVDVATGRIVAFLDGDDIFGSKWLRAAFEFSRRFDHDNWCLHPKFSVMFGVNNLIHEHFGDGDHEVDARDMVQFNPWSALAFAPKSVFERFPYVARTKQSGNEDWTWNVQTYQGGVTHQCVPDGVHMIRLKGDMTALSQRVHADKAQLGRCELFDRRNIPPARKAPAQQSEIPQTVFAQAQFAHYELAEYQAIIAPDTPMVVYPRQTIFDDQAWLRDAIGDANHIILVERMVKGGAELYAMNWAKALADAGARVALVQTGAGPAPWQERATATGARIVQWFRQQRLKPEEEAGALQRALIQIAPKSTFVCNSSLGWTLLHINHLLAGERVFCASFSDIPEPPGFTRHPAYHLRDLPPTLSIVTDNQRHGERLARFHGVDDDDGRIIVLPPRAEYSGPTKRAQLDRKRLRVLWAGRGTHEKQPGMVPHIAAAMKDRADFHVWGDVQPMPHALDNLKYRGPFDGFEKIEGAYDCLLITSKTEGMTNIALEATLAGLPIVSSDVGGMRELTRFLFTSHNTSAEKQIAGAVAALDALAKEHPPVDKAQTAVRAWAADFQARVLALTGAK